MIISIAAKIAILLPAFHRLSPFPITFEIMTNIREVAGGKRWANETRDSCFMAIDRAL